MRTGFKEDKTFLKFFFLKEERLSFHVPVTTLFPTENWISATVITKLLKISYFNIIAVDWPQQALQG